MHRKKYWLAAGILAIVLVIAAAVYIVAGQQPKPDETETLESGEEIVETPETVLPAKGKLTDDLRLQEYHFIQLTDRMRKGDRVDVRISFPNGADFVLLSGKEIADIGYEAVNEEGGVKSVWLYVTEEELLRVSSAVVDAYLNDGCEIYAVAYVSEDQKQAVVTYPVNEVVAELMEDDPNIVKRASNVVEWRRFRELELEDMPPGYGDAPSESGKDSAQQQKEIQQTAPEEAGGEIVYFD